MDERDRAEMERILAAAKPIADRLGLKLTIDPEKAGRFRPISGPENERVAAWVEAGARAMLAGQGISYDDMPKHYKEVYLRQTRASLTAALAAAEADGGILARVPGEPNPNVGGKIGAAWSMGHHACRAAVLAG